VILLPLALLLAGCCAAGSRSMNVTARPPADRAGISQPQYLDDLRAYVNVPDGWHARALEQDPASPHSFHRVWVSPTTRTAYGVIHFSLPLPVGHELALIGFLQQMKRNEGQAELMEKRWDPNLSGLRFVAGGGEHTIRGNLLVRGFEGWVIYAGTVRDFPIIQEELALAERAREYTELRGAQQDAKAR
jgi:hypothetical protein